MRRGPQDLDAKITRRPGQGRGCDWEAVLAVLSVPCQAEGTRGGGLPPPAGARNLTARNGAADSATRGRAGPVGASEGLRVSETREKLRLSGREVAGCGDF